MIMATTIIMEGENIFTYTEYQPTCKYGLKDCIFDPAYIKATYPKWYEKIYDSKTPEEASRDPRSCQLCTENNNLYDNEDK